MFYNHTQSLAKFCVHTYGLKVNISSLFAAERIDVYQCFEHEHADGACEIEKYCVPTLHYVMFMKADKRLICYSK